MKALRKKYGKKRWEDTPNAAWWHKKCSLQKALASIMLNAHAHQSMAHINAIRSTSASDRLSQIKKTIAIANAEMDALKGVARIHKDYGSPPPKNKSQS